MINKLSCLFILCAFATQGCNQNPLTRGLSNAESGTMKNGTDCSTSSQMSTQDILMNGSSSIQIFGHRGSSLRHPENTLTAVREALQYFDGAEIDIQLTQDKIPIVLHDETLARTAQGRPENKSVPKEILRASVERLQWNQIQNVVVGNEGEKLPRLESVLDILKEFPRKRLLIEIKSYKTQNSAAKTNMIEALSQLFSQIDPKVKEQSILISFDATVLMEAAKKENLSSIPRYWLLTGQHIKNAVKDGKLSQILKSGESFTGLDIESGPYLQEPLEGGKTIITLVKERGLKVITWVNRSEKTDGAQWMKVSEDQGAEIFTSDLPEDIWKVRGH